MRHYCDFLFVLFSFVWYITICETVHTMHNAHTHARRIFTEFPLCSFFFLFSIRFSFPAWWWCVCVLKYTDLVFRGFLFFFRFFRLRCTALNRDKGHWRPSRSGRPKAGHSTTTHCWQTAAAFLRRRRRRDVVRGVFVVWGNFLVLAWGGELVLRVGNVRVSF